MAAAALALLAFGTIAAFAQSPSQQIQAQQERAARQSSEELKRGIVREQREQVEREHAEELLLQQRRAEEDRQKQAQVQAEAEEMQRGPDLRQEPPPALPIIRNQPVPVKPKPDFSPGLMGRALGAGLLAGAAAFVLGKMVRRPFRHG